MNSISDIPDALQSFIQAIAYSSEAKVTFQIFSERQDGKVSARVLHGAAKKHYTALKKHNENGAGIFLMVNEGDFKGRKAENVTKVRALFADFDGADHKPALEILAPHMVVETSPGKFHVYWLVNDCPLEDFSKLQKAIARRFGSDPSVHDLARVMRLPGFMHQKSDNPFLVRIVEKKAHPAYDKATITKSLGLELPSGHDKSKAEPNCQIVSDGTVWEAVDKTTGEIVNLKNWAMECPDFLIADTLRSVKADVLLETTTNGKLHIRCPFNHEHTDTSDDNATFCINGSSSDTAGFVIKCLHAHCVERDRLDFIAKMLELGWLTLDSLYDRKFLAENVRPKWVKQDIDYLNRCPIFNAHTPDEKRIFLHFRHNCLCVGEGDMPDDSWHVARLLGLDEPSWERYRETFLRSRLLRSDNGRLIHDETLRTYRTSQTEYEKAVRSGRRGGKSKRSG